LRPDLRASARRLARGGSFFRLRRHTTMIEAPNEHDVHSQSVESGKERNLTVTMTTAPSPQPSKRGTVLRDRQGAARTKATARASLDPARDAVARKKAWAAPVEQKNGSRAGKIRKRLHSGERLENEGMVSRHEQGNWPIEGGIAGLVRFPAEICEGMKRDGLDCVSAVSKMSRTFSTASN
jgi:hypothetical protein